MAEDIEKDDNAATGSKVAAVDDDAAAPDEGDEAAEALANASEAALADDNDDDQGMDEDNDTQWRSERYDSHYGGEWPSPELASCRKSWKEERIELPGLGPTQTSLPPSTATKLAAVSTGTASGVEKTLREFGVIPPLRSAWREAYGDEPLSEAQRSLMCTLSSHADLHFSGVPLDAYDELMPILALHAVQHITLTQKMLQRHKRKGLAPQDQGFTRPTVLVLLPFRVQAHAFMRAALRLLPPCYEQVENKGRFFKEYAEEDGAPPMPASKPDDYRRLFDGNNDDCFRCALRLTRKACKLYSPFYAADLIVGSPLGLRSLVGEGDQAKRRKGPAAARAARRRATRTG